jgi:hypothetical protein
MAIKEHKSQRSSGMILASSAGIKSTLQNFRESAAPTAFISDDDMHMTIRIIVENLPGSIEGFQFASQVYGSDFFDGETPAFRSALATALNSKFPSYKNYYWLKLATENQPQPQANPNVG